MISHALLKKLFIMHDTKRLAELIAQVKSRLQVNLSSSGHTVAAMRALSYESVYAFYNDATIGIAYNQMIRRLDEQMKENPQAVAEKLQQLMNKLEGESAVKTGMTLNIAINYGGRPEIVRAAQQLAEKAAAGQLKPEEITEQMLSDAMYTAGQKDPDFILRPSGEKRLSNFMLWQAAYSELVEMDVLWPDFTRADLDTAIEEFNHRSRRFGGL